MRMSDRPEYELSACSRCGCTGIHSCTGKPIVWSDGDVARFHAVLATIFGPQAGHSTGDRPWIIYCDLDGVHTDFYGQAARLIGKDYKNMRGAEAWAILDQVPHLFRDLAPLPDSADLWHGMTAFAQEQGMRVEILSAMPKLTRELVTVPQDKFSWVRQHLSSAVPVNLVPSGRAKAAFAHPRAVLIDDLGRNIDEWRQAGGIGILHRSARESLAELQEISARIAK